MKIIRNGIEYELTECELHEAYREREKLYRIEDIKIRMDKMKIDQVSIDMDAVLIRLQSAIDDDNYLWYSYWSDVEYAIKQEIDANNKEA